MSNDQLAIAARVLDDSSVDESEGEVRGTFEGVAVTVRMVTRNPGSYSTRHTEVSVKADTTGFSLALRPQTESEEDDVAQGLAVDLKLGDKEFDSAFIVEAAPSDVVEQLLDDDLRAKLMSVRPAEVLSGHKNIRVDQDGWVDELVDMTGLIELAVSLARRIPLAREEAERAAGDGGYRGDDGAARSAAKERELELLILERVKKAKSDARHKRQMMTCGLLVLLMIALFAVSLGAIMAKIERGEAVDFSDFSDD